jgi:uncharacterized membrane protein
VIKNILLTFAVFLGIDFVWLGFIAKNFYDKELSAFNRALNIPAAFLAYLLLSFGLYYFVISKVDSNTTKALINGAIFGLIAYGTYDLSNLATLSDFTLKMAVVDMLWGMTICATTSLLVTLILK